jgi:ferritin
LIKKEKLIFIRRLKEMLNEKIVQLVNDQVNKEFYSAYLYLEISNFYVEKGLDGFAHWFMEQAIEEKEHALKFMSYLQDNSHSVVLDKIGSPTTKFADLRTPLVAALNHERYVTNEINKIYHEAVALKDYRSQEFLDWFVKEQGEEELNAETLIQKYDLFANEAAGLYALNKELGKRED